jgi:hypothetical protein
MYMKRLLLWLFNIVNIKSFKANNYSLTLCLDVRRNWEERNRWERVWEERNRKEIELIWYIGWYKRKKNIKERSLIDLQKDKNILVFKINLVYYINILVFKNINIQLLFLIRFVLFLIL